MQIGKYKLYTVQTGLFKLDGGAMFGVVPKSLWSKTNPADDRNRIDMCMRALLLVSDDRKILIDNGIGYKLSEKINEIYGVDHSVYTLESELNKLGYKPDDITDVILTHLHFDHAGGSTKTDENGQQLLTFPNAVHHVQLRHWKWAHQPTDRDKASFMNENYDLIEQKKQLNLLNGDHRFDENIFLYVVNGHTPAQQLVHIFDDERQMLYAADLIPTSSHVPLPYIMGYDLFPLTTLDEKKKIIPKAADEKWLIFYEHDPSCETSIIHKSEKGFIAAEKTLLSKLSD